VSLRVEFDVRWARLGCIIFHGDDALALTSGQNSISFPNRDVHDQDDLFKAGLRLTESGSTMTFHNNPLISSRQIPSTNTVSRRSAYAEVKPEIVERTSLLYVNCRAQ